MSFFVRSTLQTLLVRISLTVVTFGIGVINARWLGPEGVGILALLLLVKTFGFRFGNLGFGSSFAFFVAKKQADFHKVMSLSSILSMALSIACILAFLVFWKSPFSPWNDLDFLHYAIALSALPFCFYNNYVQRVLSGRLRITQINAANALAAVAQVLSVVAFVIVVEGGVGGAVSASLFSEVVMTAFLFRYARREIAASVAPESQPEEAVGAGLLRRLWQYGRWNYLLMFSNLLVEEVPLVFLKKYTGDNALVGLFSRARSLGRQSQVIVEPVASLLFPFTAASREEEATRRTNVLCRNSVLIMGLVITTLMIFIKPIIRLLYGEAFLPAAEIFYVLAPGVIIFPFGHFLEVHVAASGKPRDIFFASVSTLAAALIICLTLIPLYGAIGAGLSVSLIYLARAIFRFIAYVRMTRSPVAAILVPTRQDITYYQMVFRSLSAGLVKRIRPT